jgi:hypothetical protein
VTPSRVTKGCGLPAGLPSFADASENRIRRIDGTGVRGPGFCGTVKEGQPLHVDSIIPPSGPVTADQFVEWVFLADNMNPNSEPEKWQKLKDQIRAAFIEHMGREVVDAAELRWSPEA